MIAPQRLSDIDQRRFTQRGQAVPDEVMQTARRIIDEVQAEGDVALRRLTSDFDGVDLDDAMLPADEWERLAAACPSDVQEAIQANLPRIIAFHAAQLQPPIDMELAPGLRLGRRPVPHRVAACYVPGGRASYPSTVMMTVPLARIAGVETILVVTPPRSDGTIDPAVAFAAKEAGATAIVRAGGAQAIAALALGTGSLPRADCIVGPGNAYVTAAKQLLAGRVWTDAPAGPSELLILADDSADPEFVAADMVAQAEHDPDAQCLLVTDSQSMADAVATVLAEQAASTARADIVKQSLEDHGAILVADSLDEAIDFANAYAPEHLEVMTEGARDVADRIRNAGSIFVGENAPVSIGDYGSGTNHVLPTMGHARIRGGLSVSDFQKWVTWQEVTSEGLRSIASDITTLARSEGLDAHADAVDKRLEARQ